MNYSNEVKIIVYVPTEDADKIRQVMHQAGAGIIGDYSHCSWSTVGTGRIVPEDGADPAIGNVGEPEKVKEERIEILCPKNILQDVVVAMKKAHPYEEVAYDVYERLEI